MPDTAPEPTPPASPPVVAVRWRLRDESGRPIGPWHAEPALTTVEAAIAFQTIWLVDLDVEVQVVTQ